MMTRYLFYISFLIPFLSVSCDEKCVINGRVTDESMNGDTVRLLRIVDGEIVFVIDGVVEGQVFCIEGIVDSVFVAELYVGQRFFSPLVVEAGTIEVCINPANSNVDIEGSDMNSRLNDFVRAMNDYEDSIKQAFDDEVKMILDGVPSDVATQVKDETVARLNEERVEYALRFINYHNRDVLGPYALYMCGTDPHFPFTRERISDIIRCAPFRFQEDEYAKYVESVWDN